MIRYKGVMDNLNRGTHMRPFRKNTSRKTIFADVTDNTDGSVDIDVRDQTCPGYLLAINKAMDTLDAGKKAFLITTYAPVGDDVKAWCNEKGYTYAGIVQKGNRWEIGVIKN